MKYFLSASCSLILALISGCATTSANMKIGTDRSDVSLGDQRLAALTVVEMTNPPAAAVRLKTVDASRCHRRADQTAPTEEDVKLDLRIAAYAIGADVITGVKIERSSGLSQNCWYILSGEATAWSMKK